jgi:ABC-type Fe3+/spermidine/putrescine transport system ATPase subunit
MLEVELEKCLGNTLIEVGFTSRALKSVVFGPSGCGKTTLLKMLSGLCSPERGRIGFRQEVVFDSAAKMTVPTHKRNFAYLPQKCCLFPHMDVRANIAYPLRLQGCNKVEGLVREWAQRLGIAPLLARYPGQLSGGQQQRVALARAFASRPALLLLDEPFSALDQGVREEMRDILITLVDEFQIPALLVTHDREEAYVFGEHMVVMHDGRVLESGVLEQIYHTPVCLETARMLGFDNSWRIAGYEESLIVLENGWKVKSGGEARGAATHLCIRPEDVMILRPDRPLKHGVRDNVISVILRRIHPRGRHYKLVVEASSNEYLDINIPAHAFRVMGLHQGQTLNISLKSQGLVACRDRLSLPGEEV